MSRWGTARWGVDRWPALAVADLLQQPPSTGRGVPTGIGDWRLSVEILLPSDQLSTWGTARWGQQQWNVLAWQDLTPFVRGLQWSRGADEPFGRPRVGELVVTLASLADEFSPWNQTPPVGAPVYFGPGTIIRVGVRSATDTRAGGWLPQITCVVDQWSYVYGDPTATERYVDVRAVETLRDLAQIDSNALPGVVGGGESAQARFERLLEAAKWPYGLLIEAQNVAGGGYTMQSTNMAQNRLAECYLTADSCDAVFRTDRTGAAIVTNPEYAAPPVSRRFLPLVEFSSLASTPAVGFSWFPGSSNAGAFRYVPYLTDSFKSAPDDSNLVNDARFARVGGVQQVWERQASISRYGRRTLVRNDLLTTSDVAVQTIVQYITERRGLNVLRVNEVKVDVSSCLPVDALAVLAADLYSRAFIFPPGAPVIPATAPYIDGFIANVAHKVTPRNGAQVTWEATFGFDTRRVMNIPGAQLPTT